jgi:hypothetical protein
VWRTVWICVLGACDEGVDLPGGPGDDTPAVGEGGLLDIVDRAIESGYLDGKDDHFERGRSTGVLDVDGDGDPDVVSANPGDTTYVNVNDSVPGGPLAFHRGPEIDTTGACYWSVGGGDLDNDGDPDLFAGYGGNETKGFDVVYRNDGDPEAPFVDVTDSTNAIILSPGGERMSHATAGVLLFDFDNDARLDVYESISIPRTQIGEVTVEDVSGLNPLWRNQGGMRFEDVGVASGLVTQRDSRHSSFLDIENDGDLDLFENNFQGGNVLWRNLLVETGQAVFEDVTEEFSLGGCDLSFPKNSGPQTTLATDLDNDGFEDLVTFRRNGPKEFGEPAVHAAGHLLWMNQQGHGFVEVATFTDINDRFVWRDHEGGVMGCQVADWNADGFPDLFVGNGGPAAGESSQLYLSATRTTVEITGVGRVTVPQFTDDTELIDTPTVLPADWSGPVPVYPYRTHGSVAADFDGDGDLELAQHNGGPMAPEFGTDEFLQEPDRLWDVVFADPQPHWLTIDLVGDGVAVNTDGVGAKIHVVAEEPDGTLLDLYQVRRTQTGFSAQNQPGVHFGLAEAVSIVSLVVTWPDGVVQEVDEPELDTRITVRRS